MESQYVDVFLRKKMAGEGQMPGQYANDNASLHAQVATCEDKIINLTKLVKLSQGLANEKENDLRKENHELKTRLRRQEQTVAKFARELDQLRSLVPGSIDSAIENAVTPLKRDVATFERTMKESTESLSAQNRQIERDVRDNVMNQTHDLVNVRVTQAEEAASQSVRAASKLFDSEIARMKERFEVMETQKLESLRKSATEEIKAATEAVKATILDEVRSCIRANNDSVREDLKNMTALQATLEQRISKVEQQVGTLDSAFAEFVDNFKESAAEHARKADETAASMKELLALHEQTRTVVANELEGTKQWATRNLHRLKKHIDVANADITALREGSIETNAQLQKLQTHTQNEHERLTALLAQKTTEASKLTEMVDKEISSMHGITQSHRSVTSTDVDRRRRRTNLYADLAFEQEEK